MTDPNHHSSVAQLVRVARTERGWSQEYLAEAAGISLRTVQRVERGSACSGGTLQALATAFGLDAAELSGLAANRRPRAARRFGLSGPQALWLGAALSLPTLLFVAVNIGYFELGWRALAPVLPTGARGELWSNPILLLGGPLVTIIINWPHVFSFKRKKHQMIIWLMKY